MKFTFISAVLILLLYSCNKDENSKNLKEDSSLFTISGQVTDNFGVGLEGVQIFYNTSEFTVSDNEGFWEITDLEGQNTITSTAMDYNFFPTEILVNDTVEDLLFEGIKILNENETQIYNWFSNQQLSNGLLESAEDSNFVSLYDNALAAMVFMLRNDFIKAEKIFDYFNSQISTELTNGVGGFSQLRDRNGIPNNHRWMGDNAWLLIALNNYKHRTGFSTYDNLALELKNWLIALQDTDGGLFAGYDLDNNLLNYKVTEGNIDAFNAIDNYTVFHSQILEFLENDRWDDTDKNLVAWPSNPPYLYALDLHSWSYSIFKNYPVTALTTAHRFLTTQTATNGSQIIGYCFDEDRDTVWLEGTGQMALAFSIAGMQNEKELYLIEMENVLIQSTSYANSRGFPYASNPGTTYSIDSLWTGADTEIAISGGAWYLFTKLNFNPFAVGRDKNIPEEDMFWVN